MGVGEQESRGIRPGGQSEWVRRATHRGRQYEHVAHHNDDDDLDDDDEAIDSAGVAE